MVSSHIVRPQSATSALEARSVARAYNFPLQFTGRGFTAGIIELGGGATLADVNDYFASRNLPIPSVSLVGVDGAGSKPGDPADGEVMLDIEVAAAVAPGAAYRVYFAPNSDAGFLDAINQAVRDGCDVISISWGGPEDSWSTASLDAYDKAFAAARAAGVTVFAAAGDSGSGDGESGNHVDFPASSPNVVGCGGTRLTVNADGSRSTETVWNDSTSSATGGGVSVHFPGRQVPDVAGNADPVTGYKVLVDGQNDVVGGTSAVAPLYAGLALLLSEAVGARIGTVADFLKTVQANTDVCFDVTSGNNGAFRAGPGRDLNTGFGVVDGSRLLSLLQKTSAPVPAPVPVPSPAPKPVPSPIPIADEADHVLVYELLSLGSWMDRKKYGNSERVRKALLTWIDAKNL